MQADKCAALEVVCSVTTQKLQWDKSGLWSPLLVEVSQHTATSEACLYPRTSSRERLRSFHVINSSSELQREYSPLHMLPEILLAGVFANVSSEMTQTYFKRPKKSVMALWNSSLNKVKPKRELVWRITHKRIVWFVKWTLKRSVWWGQRTTRRCCIESCIKLRWPSAEWKWIFNFHLSLIFPQREEAGRRLSEAWGWRVVVAVNVNKGW